MQTESPNDLCLHECFSGTIRARQRVTRRNPLGTTTERFDSALFIGSSCNVYIDDSNSKHKQHKKTRSGQRTFVNQTLKGIALRNCERNASRMESGIEMAFKNSAEAEAKINNPSIASSMRTTRQKE